MCRPLRHFHRFQNPELISDDRKTLPHPDKTNSLTLLFQNSDFIYLAFFQLKQSLTAQCPLVSLTLFHLGIFVPYLLN